MKANEMRDQHLNSRVLKFILASNYFYNILDDVKGTVFYKQELKYHLNKTEQALDKIHKTEAMREFFAIADPEKYLNNLELHEAFFEKLIEMNVTELEEFMINFVKPKKENK